MTPHWPSLPLDAWEDTFATLHRWAQIVGKIRLTQTPRMNHSWHVPLYVTTRGLTTSPIPHGVRRFEITFDFLEHQLRIHTSDGIEDSLPLRAQSVAEFYEELLGRLDRCGLGVSIYARPNELEDNTPFAEDFGHASYDPEFANRFWQILVQTDRVFQQFRARFTGKCSAVHFFWGSFDLAVTRFSGRPAPLHPGGMPNMPDWVVQEAYSHEQSSSGFWPGGGAHRFPFFYGYTYPEPDGYVSAVVKPESAFYSESFREWVLPYDAVREAESPDEVLLDFLQSTYEAGANLGRWHREVLERS